MSRQLEDVVDCQTIQGKETRKKVSLGWGIVNQESMTGIITRRRNLMLEFGPSVFDVTVCREVNTYIYIYLLIKYVYEIWTYE